MLIPVSLPRPSRAGFLLSQEGLAKWHAHITESWDSFVSLLLELTGTHAWNLKGKSLRGARNSSAGQAARQGSHDHPVP